MNTLRSLLLATTLMTVGGCHSAPKQVGADTAAAPAPPPTDSVVPPTASTATPAPTSAAPSAAATKITTRPQAQVKSQPPVKDPALAKTAATPSAADLAARAVAARADSLRQAQATADAMKARADSVRQAEATRATAAVKVTPTVTPPPPPAALEGQAEAGKAPYEENCRKCHGVRGIPPKTMKEKFPKIATFDAAFFETHSADSIVTVLTKGKNDDMKSFKDKLTNAEMAAVAAYIRSFLK